MHFYTEKYFRKVDESDSQLYFGLIIFETISSD